MDETLAIPQAAQVESLNAGVAASIVLYEAARKSEVKGQNAEVKSQSSTRTAEITDTHTLEALPLQSDF